MAHDCSRTQGPPSKVKACKACSRIFATTSAEGDLVPAGSKEQACDTCGQFGELHSDLQNKDAAFKAYEGRRYEHAGRYQALEEAKAAHKAFDNFLIQVEAHPEPEGQQQSQGQDKGHEADGSEQRGQKRPLTPTTSSNLVKRLRRTMEPLRRVSFDADVVFRDEPDRRSDAVWNRGSEEYVPGRNAPRQGKEHLDTSGFGTTPTRFFGMKKHGKGWVQTKEGKEMDELWSEGADEENERGMGDEGDSKEASRRLLAKDKALFSDDDRAEGNDVGERGKGHAPSMLHTDEEAQHMNEELVRSELAGTAIQGSYTEEASFGNTQYEFPAAEKVDLGSAAEHRSGTEPSPARTEDKAWQYGAGWSKEISPSSRLKGEQWKPTEYISLSGLEIRENQICGQLEKR